MSGIFSTLSVARSALLAQGAAIRTTGQNIANAGTEGYTRQQVQFTAARPETLEGLSVGTGVEIARIERIIDQQLEASLRDAGTTLSNLQMQSKMLGQIETILNDLADQGIGPTLDRFFAALNDLAARPEDQTLRRQVVAAADALSDALDFAAKSLQTLTSNINDEIVTSVDLINDTAVEIAQLNVEILRAEKGGQDIGTANDLRDRRDMLVKTLSGQVDLTAVETPTGAVNIMVNNTWLVYGQTASTLVLDEDARNELVIATPRFEDGGHIFAPENGGFGALLNLRDQIIPSFEDSVNSLAHTLIDRINRIHSQSEGLARFTQLTGTNSVDSPTAALDQAGLAMSVRDGRFSLTVKNENTGHVDTYDIAVNLSDPDAAMTLADLADAINNAVGTDHPGVTAGLTHDFKLAIQSDSPTITFGFADDDAGILSALGLNTFFTGDSATDMDVNSLVRDNLDFFAAGHGAGIADNSGVLAMLAMREEAVIENDTLENWWIGQIGQLGVERAHARELAENQQVIYDNLLAHREALSGVNIDEETINLMQYQRAYQAAARLLSVVDTLIATLLQSV